MKNEFLDACVTRAGDPEGATKMAQVAWFMATNSPEYYEWLHGKEMGTNRSWDYLKAAKNDALEVFDLIYDLWEAYRKSGSIEKTEATGRVTYSFVL